MIIPGLDDTGCRFFPEEDPLTYWNIGAGVVAACLVAGSLSDPPPLSVIILIPPFFFLIWHGGRRALKKNVYFIGDTTFGYHDFLQTRIVRFDEVKAIALRRSRTWTRALVECRDRELSLPVGDPGLSLWWQELRKQLEARGIPVG